MTPARSPLETSESVFQSVVVDLARMNGWRIFHARPSQVRPGRWATSMTGDVGFPDLVLVHKTRGVIFAELKTRAGRPSPGQIDWLLDLRAAGAEAHLWRPADLEEISRRLGGRP